MSRNRRSPLASVITASLVAILSIATSGCTLSVSSSSLKRELCDTSKRNGLGIACVAGNRLLVRTFEPASHGLGDPKDFYHPFRIKRGYTFGYVDRANLFLKDLRDGRITKTSVPQVVYAFDVDTDLRRVAVLVAERAQSTAVLKVIEIGNGQVETSRPLSLEGERFRLSVCWLDRQNVLVSDESNIYRIDVQTGELRHVAEGSQAELSVLGDVAYQNSRREWAVGRLVGSGIVDSFTDGRRALSYARWSPDGKYLVYAVMDYGLIPWARIVVREMARERQVLLVPVIQTTAAHSDGGYDWFQARF